MKTWSRSIIRLAGSVSSICLGVLLLIWVQDAYDAAHYLGAMAAFGALALFAAGLTITVRPVGDHVRRVKNIGWLAGAFATSVFVVGLVLGRTVGVPGYHHSGWPAIDIFRLGLAGIYLTAFVSCRLAGGAAAPLRTTNPAFSSLSARSPVQGSIPPHPL